MVKEFLEGETYRNALQDHDILVLGIGEETNKEVVLAVLYVDRETNKSIDFGEEIISRTEFNDWLIVEY